MLFHLRCSSTDGELVSVDYWGEKSVLSGSLALSFLPTTQSVLTSGVRLTPTTWYWLGAGENITDTIILEDLEAGNTTNSLNTQCIVLSWDQTDNETETRYTSQDCVTHTQNILCEVRVYTQTWYYWATANWLQILFCLTLVLLILSTCVTVSVRISSDPPQQSSI